MKDTEECGFAEHTFEKYSYVYSIAVDHYSLNCVCIGVFAIVT
jgi:hypothetical protein